MSQNAAPGMRDLTNNPWKSLGSLRFHDPSITLVFFKLSFSQFTDTIGSNMVNLESNILDLPACLEVVDIVLNCVPPMRGEREIWETRNMLIDDVANFTNVESVRNFQRDPLASSWRHISLTQDINTHLRVCTASASVRKSNYLISFAGVKHGNQHNKRPRPNENESEVVYKFSSLFQNNTRTDTLEKLHVGNHHSWEIEIWHRQNEESQSLLSRFGCCRYGPPKHSFQT